MKAKARYHGILSYHETILHEDEDNNIHSLRIRALTALQQEQSGVEVRLMDRVTGEAVACYRKSVREF